MTVTVVVRQDAIDRWVEGAENSVVDKHMATIAQEIADKAKQRAPVATGALQRSIHIEVLPRSARRIIASTDYALYVELGTSKMSAQPYLRPALDEVMGG